MRWSTRSALAGLAAGFVLGLIPSLYLSDLGKVRLENNQLLEKLERAQSKDLSRAVTRVSGVALDLDVDDFRQNKPQIKREPTKQRKIFLDCGANVASTVQLFRETYPGGRDFTIHSFEIDERLSPYFEPYDKHHLHCPVGVAGKDGNMTAYSEMVWGPNKGLNAGADMQWGGGTLFAFESEKRNNKTGGGRKLSVRKTIPVIDLSKWIADTFSPDDYIIFKLDVEGAEYDILRNMLDNNVFATYVDKYYGEYHDYQPSGWAQKDKDKIRDDIEKLDMHMISWEGERRTYGDIEDLNPVKVPFNAPGRSGLIYSSCASGSVAVVVAVGMNYKRAHAVVSTLAAHKPLVPTTLFVYGDFAQLYPEAVRSWAQHFNIGIREDGPQPPGHLEQMPSEWVRLGLMSTILRLEEIGIVSSYYLPSTEDKISPRMIRQIANRGLRIVQPAVQFPGKKGSPEELTFDNYYRHRDVDRVPKALRLIHDALFNNKGGVLCLETDLSDTYMNSVFLMDYLVETSGFKLVDLEECIAKTSIP
ncbi:uncharacterized protein LOC119745168 [Patiria miniata]|uniref:Methyltransferase FkbM domain-containing protein n=1 Tax=Patiria miniata TaxID=46514 RepID=A0A914BNN7_PATMI|nr:uncharacterized protein LOC119745168 [Patiria miniata]